MGDLLLILFLLMGLVFATLAGALYDSRRYFAAIAATGYSLYCLFQYFSGVSV